MYLQADVSENYNWHCRIDIPYVIMDHVIPFFDNGQRATLTFTLKSPPKFYNIQSTDDLHLYAGEEAPQATDMLSAFANLNLRPQVKANRLERLCGLNASNNKNSALCMASLSCTNCM
jgi:hypothetical protein